MPDPSIDKRVQTAFMLFVVFLFAFVVFRVCAENSRPPAVIPGESPGQPATPMATPTP